MQWVTADVCVVYLLSCNESEIYLGTLYIFSLALGALYSVENNLCPCILYLSCGGRGDSEGHCIMVLLTLRWISDAV